MLFVNINSSFLISLYIMGIVAINKMISSKKKNISIDFVFLLLLQSQGSFYLSELFLTYFSGIEQEISCSSLL